MAYNDLVTQDLLGIDIDEINNTVKAPVGNTRAYIETVNQGLQQLINNDVTLDLKKIDGKDGGNYTLDIAKYISLLGANAQCELALGLRTRLYNNGTTSLGSLYESQDSISATTTSTIAGGNFFTAKRYYGIGKSGDTVVRNRILKFHAEDMVGDHCGKEITFNNHYYNTAGQNFSLDVRIYYDYDKYVTTDSTGFTNVKIFFGTYGFRSVTFISDLNDYINVCLFPTSYILQNTNGEIDNQYMSDLYFEK